MPDIKAGPAWIILQELNDSYEPTGAVVNLGYQKDVKTTFKKKVYKIEPDNAPGPVEELGMGLEECKVEASLISISTDILAQLIGERRETIGTPFGDTDVISATGFDKSPSYQIMIIYSDLLKNRRLFERIQNNLSITVDIVEMRTAVIGGEAVEYTAPKDSERQLKFLAQGLSKMGVNAIPAKIKLNATLSTSNWLNTAGEISAYPPSLY